MLLCTKLVTPTLQSYMYFYFGGIGVSYLPLELLFAAKIATGFGRECYSLMGSARDVQQNKIPKRNEMKLVLIEWNGIYYVRSNVYEL